MFRSRLRWVVLSAAVLTAAVSVACSQAAHDAQGSPPCKTNCGHDSTGGIGSSKDGGAATDAGVTGDSGADGGGVAVDVSATVVVYGEPTFTAADVYGSAATLEADKAGGGTVSVPYGAADGTTVTLTGVASGLEWVLVRDDSGGQTGILSTYSLHTFPANGTALLPVLSRPVLSAIFSGLPLPGVLDAAAAQIVLRFGRKGVPLAGIKLAAPVHGTTVVFDNGPGVYTTDAQATSTGGMLLLLNTAVTGAGGVLSLSVVDSLADAGPATYNLVVPTVAGTAAFAEIDLAP